MLTGLEALGLACNVMQVISFAGGTITTIKAIYQGHSPDTAVTITATQMSKALEDLSQSLEQAPKPLNQDEMEMLDIAKQCLAAAAKLKVELDKIWDGKTKRSFRVALTGAVKQIWKKGKIEDLEKVLRAHRETIENRLLQRICKQSDAILLQQDSGFGKLDAKLRHFIEAFAAGETRLAGLVTNESESVKNHVTLQSSQLRDDICTQVASDSAKTHVVLSELSTHVTSEVSQARHELSLRIKETATVQSSEAEHQQLVDSLRYETMNQRRNQILDSYEDTFGWIFGRTSNVGSYDSEDLDDSELLQVSEDGTNSESSGQSDNELVELSAREKSSQSFLRWLHSEGPSLYWISGKAGSGKSTLIKFLVDDPQTEAELGDHIILSHFVWMAGQQMERSIRGITCSLLHQLLQEDRGLPALILDRIPHTRRNKFCGDWSIKDLEAALFVALAASLKPVCIFLDGLDEIDSLEEQNTALDLVNRLCSRVSQLKVCVSSRPEPIFQRRLSNFPTLHLQDLTQEDIKTYITGELRGAFNANDPEFWEFVEQVCEKSDGVFLWVSLAVKSLQRGKWEENTLEELEKRLETLPRHLHELYESMWHRLNDDQPIYRADAAQFLNYVLTSESRFIIPMFQKWTSIYNLTLAKDTCLRHRILEDNYMPSAGEWISRIEATAKALESRCAGLLDIYSDWGVQSVRLIHRSAKEFLENTPHGQQILQYDTSTVEDRISNIISAQIALGHLAFFKRPADVVLVNRVPYNTPINIISALQMSSERGHISVAKVMEVMKHAEALYHRSWAGRWPLGLIPPGNLQTSLCLNRDFLGAAVYKGFVDFVGPSLDKLEKSAPTGSLSPSYKGYLVITACVGVSNLQWLWAPGRDTHMLEFLLDKWSNTSIGHWDLGVFGLYALFAKDNLIRPCTPMMALCDLAFAEPPLNFAWTSLEGMLRRGTGGSLEDVTTFSVLAAVSDKFAFAEWQSDEWIDDTYVFDMRHNQFNYFNTKRRSRPSLFIEANMSYILDLYQRALQVQPSATPVEAARNLAAEATRHSVPKTAKVWYVIGGVGGDDAHPVRPASEAESSYLLELLLNLNLSRVESKYRRQLRVKIPGLGRRMREVTTRGKPYPLSEVRRDLEQRGLSVVEENVKDWPPKPYDS